MCIEAFAMKNIEDQSLHCTFQLGMWRMPFDGPESSPYNVIDSAWQILKVFNKELLRICSIWRQRLHHAKHLTHVWFRLVKIALHSSTVKLTTRFIRISCSGQTSELNDIKGFGFVMNISCHPLQDPSLRISVVATYVKCGIKLEQQLFVPVLLVGDEGQQSDLFEAIQSFFQTGQTSYCFGVKMLMWEDATLIVQNAGVIASPRIAPEPIRRYSFP